MALSSCALVLFWIESNSVLDRWSHARHYERTSVGTQAPTELRDPQADELSPEVRLLRAVDKLPFKVMTPSSLLLEDLYFTPSDHKLVDYNNPVIHQPLINCSGSEVFLILVPSHPESVGERRAIRETWGSLARGRPWPGKGGHFAVKLVFVLGVAGDNFQPETIHSAETVSGPETNTPMPNTDFYFSGNKERAFSDRENKTHPVLTTKNNITGSSYENNGQYIDKLINVRDVNNVNNNIGVVVQHGRTLWRSRNAPGLFNKLKNYNMEQHNDTILLKPDQSTRTTVISHHAKTALHSNNQAGIMEEMSTFDDILQFDMIDTYSNLTRKIILSLQLLLKTCSTVQFILKVDPDIFVNVPLLATFLHRHGQKNSVYGRMYPNSVVERTGKWAVPRAALPISRYPIYAAGNAYVLSTDAVEKIVGLAPRFPYVLVEDAFITGILASVGRVNRVNVAGFTKWTEPRPDSCDFVKDKVYVGNNFTEYDLRVYWRDIIDRGSDRHTEFP
ncbi:hypothetical protein BsWGS_21156 [Bradybaena similaris]